MFIYIYPGCLPNSYPYTSTHIHCTEYNYTAGRQQLKMKLLADVLELEHFCNNSSFKFHYFIGLQKICNIQPFLEESTLSVIMLICHSTCGRKNLERGKGE